MKYPLTTVEAVLEEGSWVCTVRTSAGEKEEVILVPCGDDRPVEAWVNRCTHEDQRLHRADVGVVMRGGHIVCPKHGSTFDSCSGDCDNGPAADSTLVGVSITIDGGDIYLTDEEYQFVQKGGISDDDDGPGSTSHLRF